MQRYTEEKSLHKIERLRKYIIEREQREEKERQKESVAKAMPATFALETESTYDDQKQSMQVSIFNPLL